MKGIKMQYDKNIPTNNTILVYIDARKNKVAARR